MTKTLTLLTALMSLLLLVPRGASNDGNDAGTPAEPLMPGDSLLPSLDVPERGYYVLIYRRGPAYVDSLPAGKQPGIEGHFHHVESYVSELPGFMVLGGPYLDDQGALMIFRVPAQGEVESFAEADPIVQSGLVEYSIHPWAIAVRSDSL